MAINLLPNAISAESGRAARPKRPYDLDEMFARLRVAVEPFPKAAMFELFEEGYTSLFEQLVACILSIRTRDEVSLPTARRLFETARTPEQIAALPPEEIDRLIQASTFHGAKAYQIHAIARETVERYGGVLPCEAEVLTAFNGVGVKCSNLALGIACGQPRVAVDIHVHRVANRWGLIATATPEASTEALTAALPEQYRVEINRLLVPFGKHVCTGTRPKCSTCPLLEFCQQVGVTDPR